MKAHAALPHPLICELACNTMTHKIIKYSKKPLLIVQGIKYDDSEFILVLYHIP